MGFELNKLMRQFGVSSPTVPTYTGSTDQDRSAYNDYVQQYNNRLASVPMYNQSQFETPLSPVQAAPTSVLTPPVFSPPVTSNVQTTPTTPNYGGGAGFNLNIPNFSYDGTNYSIPSYVNPTAVSSDSYSIPSYTIDKMPYVPQTISENIYDGSQYGINKLPYIPQNVVDTPSISQPSTLSGGQREFTPSNVDMYSHGGEVKKFAVGGLNDLASNYGITDDAGIRMLPGQEAYGYGPRPKQGPLGPWIEQVVTEVVPGVTIAGRARTPERNREVGGVPDSYHLTDNARDIRPPKGMTQGELLTKLKGEFGSDFDVLTSKGSSVHVEPGPTLGKTTRSGAPAAPAAPSAELGTLTPAPSGEGEAAAPTGRAAELKMLLDGYEGESAYAEELKTARAKATEEADAFKSMLEASLESPEDAKASKAEMYFRLAAAFGSPTKTGGFGENLGLASKEMAEYSKGKRESSREKLATKLKLQELRMGAAKEELGTLRALSAEEMKDRRVMAQALIKDYIESGKPQSAAGKQALDEGYQPGTPKFQARVRELAALDVARETAQLQAILGNLKINEERNRREAGKEGKLTPKELDLKLATEDSLAAIRSAMGEIAEAYRLNPNSFDNSLPDVTRRKALELAGSQDPLVVNTGALENLLKSQTITSAAEKMKGVLSDSDIKLIMSIGGLDAKSKAERATILRNAYIKMKEGESRMARRLQQISSGAYREISGD